jgi:hypothetical protein
MKIYKKCSIDDDDRAVAHKDTTSNKKQEFIPSFHHHILTALLAYIHSEDYEEISRKYRML